MDGMVATANLCWVHAYFSKSLASLTSDMVKHLGNENPGLAANLTFVNKVTLEGLRIPNAEGAVVQRYAASLWPYKLVAFILEQLLAKCSEKGSFNLQTNTPVTRLKKVDTSNDLVAAAAMATWIVETPRGKIAAGSVLLATNGYTSHLLPQFRDLIVPTRGQVVALPPRDLKGDETPLDIRNTYYFFGDASDKAVGRDDYLVQRPAPGSELVLGGGRERGRNAGVGVWDDSELDEPVSRWLGGELSTVLDLDMRPANDYRYFSAEEEKKAKSPDPVATYAWTGIMGFSRDAHPWVGSVPPSLGGGYGLWVCAGYTGNGMPNAALCAKAVVNMMLMTDDVDLPPEYMLTETRVESALARDTVAVAAEKGVLALPYLA
ncbi:FAD dependent oxidoreductase domain-containing protein [Hirsutella rhossiliensis]|uniref:FAD dependent oxidoreductase domain-containing protein n=1 Tax=Hirsutella rhossiliensis TaxID=111463 RepID=A0A9P8MUX7_9HYPO|nr:FAD dependent oxidoreductase domain-containing protein [Hirsutella rhossiliensis]KAH0962633.1 FAD dependent oxidoreductase domain-containing protein [Hirsutella rhossiliensis]